MKKEILVLMALLCAPFFAHADTHAVTYPSRPIRLVVPFPPGGAIDTLARPIAKRLSEILGQPVLIDNRPGAGSTLGAANIAKSPADGYHLILGSSGLYLTFFYPNLPFNAFKDFTPIIHLVNIPSMLAVHPSLPIHSVKEFIEYGKKNPGKLFYGTTGIGVAHHLSGIMLAQLAEINMEHVPYKGGAPAITDALGGQVPVVILTASTLLPYTRTGKLRAIGVTENKRISVAPEIPTIRETVPGFVLPDSWSGILGPANMPRPIVEKLNAAFRQAITSPEVKRSLEAGSFEIVDRNSADEFASIIAPSALAYTKLLNASGIKPE